MPLCSLLSLILVTSSVVLADGRFLETDFDKFSTKQLQALLEKLQVEGIGLKDGVQNWMAILGRKRTAIDSSLIKYVDILKADHKGAIQAALNFFKALPQEVETYVEKLGPTLMNSYALDARDAGLVQTIVRTMLMNSVFTQAAWIETELQSAIGTPQIG